MKLLLVGLTCYTVISIVSSDNVHGSRKPGVPLHSRGDRDHGRFPVNAVSQNALAIPGSGQNNKRQPQRAPGSNHRGTPTSANHFAPGPSTTTRVRPAIPGPSRPDVPAGIRPVPGIPQQSIRPSVFMGSSDVPTKFNVPSVSGPVSSHPAPFQTNNGQRFQEKPQGPGSFSQTFPLNGPPSQPFPPQHMNTFKQPGASMMTSDMAMNFPEMKPNFDSGNDRPFRRFPTSVLVGPRGQTGSAPPGLPFRGPQPLPQPGFGGDFIRPPLSPVGGDFIRPPLSPIGGDFIRPGTPLSPLGGDFIRPAPPLQPIGGEFIRPSSAITFQPIRHEPGVPVQISAPVAVPVSIPVPVPVPIFQSQFREPYISQQYTPTPTAPVKPFVASSVNEPFRVTHGPFGNSQPITATTYTSPSHYNSQLGEFHRPAPAEGTGFRIQIGGEETSQEDATTNGRSKAQTSPSNPIGLSSYSSSSSSYLPSQSFSMSPVATWDSEHDPISPIKQVSPSGQKPVMAIVEGESLYTPGYENTQTLTDTFSSESKTGSFSWTDSKGQEMEIRYSVDPKDRTIAESSNTEERIMNSPIQHTSSNSEYDNFSPLGTKYGEPDKLITPPLFSTSVSDIDVSKGGSYEDSTAFAVRDPKPISIKSS